MLPSSVLSVNCHSYDCDYLDRADDKWHKNADLSRVAIKPMSNHGTCKNLS